MTPIVFLHVPKTAGQTVHSELQRVVGGKARVSPVRVNRNHHDGKTMPPGYRLYSGHLDWIELEKIQPRFAFTILREPKERLASYYFYMRNEGLSLPRAELERPENLGRHNAATLSTEDYFMRGGDAWQNFMRDHYENFYSSYFSTRLMRGRSQIVGRPMAAVLDQAVQNMQELDAIYRTDTLEALEEDIWDRYGKVISLVGNYRNVGSPARGQSRWDLLCERLESDAAVDRIESFTKVDRILFDRLEQSGLWAQPRGPRPSRALRRWRRVKGLAGQVFNMSR